MVGWLGFRCVNVQKGNLWRMGNGGGLGKEGGMDGWRGRKELLTGGEFV